MRKYFFGLIAILLAIGLTAFTKPLIKPTSVETFYLPTSFARTSLSNIESEVNWANGNVSCPGAAEVACKFDLDSKYWHVDQTTFINIINTPAYISSSTGRDPLDEAGEAALVINGAAIIISGTTYYKVDVANSPGVLNQVLRVH